MSEELSYFRKLLFETNNEKFSLRRDNSKKISRHYYGGDFNEEPDGRAFGIESGNRN